MEDLDDIDWGELCEKTVQCVMENTDFEKRDLIADSVAALRELESIINFKFKKVLLGRNFLETTTAKTTRFWQVLPEDPSRIEAGRKTNFTVNFIENEQLRTYELKGKSDDPFLKLLKENLRDGSEVDVLNISDLPPKLAELGNIKLTVKELHFEKPFPVIYPTIKDTTISKDSKLFFINDKEQLEKVVFDVTPATEFMFQEPVVQKCQTLELHYFRTDQLWLDYWIVTLHIQNIIVHHQRFPMEVLKLMIKKWVSDRRSIGTSFTMDTYYSKVNFAFEMVEDELNGTQSTFVNMMKPYISRCAIVPIDDEKEVVLFTKPLKKKWLEFDWMFKVEVMEKGTTVPRGQGDK